MNTRLAKVIVAVALVVCALPWLSAGSAENVEKKPEAVAKKPVKRNAPKETTPKEITFDDIKFPMEKTDTFKRSMITPEIEALSDKLIRVRGYILPTFQQSGITQFVLVRDNLECCFGPGAALYDCVYVTMKAGKSAEFSTRPVVVQGDFKVEEIPDADGKPIVIYQLDGESVE